MKRLVVDASVVAKLFFEEEHSALAERCIRGAKELLAPDLIWAEVANVIWKRRRRGEINQQQALQTARQLLALPISVQPSTDLLSDALELAMRFDRTVYDGLYLALAVKTGALLVSNDKRLVNALAGTEFEEHVAWIGAYSS